MLCKCSTVKLVEFIISKDSLLHMNIFIETLYNFIIDTIKMIQIIIDRTETHIQ